MGCNFYSWLATHAIQEVTVMDAIGNGYKHPNGEECRAKDVDNCPFYRKDKTEAEEIDDLGSPMPSYERKIKELEELCKSKELNKIPTLRNMSFETLKKGFDDFLTELEEYDAMEEPVRYHNTQKRRNEIYEKNKEKEYATINAETGEVRKDVTGFGVTFHTTLSDKEMSAEEYDKMVTKLVALGNADTYNVGIFQGGAEISIDCRDGARAIAMMLQWNQNSIYNYSSEKTIYNLTYDEKENPGLERGTAYVV